MDRRSQRRSRLGQNSWAFWGGAADGKPRTVGHPMIYGWCPSVAPATSEICILVVLAYGVLQPGLPGPLPFRPSFRISGVAGGTDGHHPWTVGGSMVRGGLRPFSQNPPKIWPSVDPRPDLRTVGEAMNRGPGSWIEAPDSSPNCQSTVDHHGPSVDPRSVDPVRR
uniref:Uncharacterized protein n=1 Tax=Solanum tuberosum TaxID=4113 RepID=M1DC47_SOLTU